MSKYEYKKMYLAIYLCLISVGAFSMMVLLIFGFVFICFGGKLKIITIVTTVIALIGVVYECFLPFLNTPDIWDAVFGVTGTAVAYIYLVMFKRNGLVAK